MPVTYQCSACNATWKADGEPHGCPSCGSRVIDRLEWSQTPFDNPYGAPMAPLVDTPLVSSTMFSVTYWLGWAVFIGGMVLMIATNDEEQPNVIGVLMILASMGLLLAAYILSIIKIYQGWKLIQPLRRIDWSESSMPTPGMAVGLLFVPFYNFYWNFVAMHGLAIRANKYMIKAGINSRPMGEGLAQTYCILTIASAIPCIQYLALLPNLIIYYVFILDVDRMRSAIQAKQLDKIVYDDEITYEEV
jgi:predicted RNA-binding Zn-ribbon protein involved in translation (DUF1610 family)